MIYTFKDFYRQVTDVIYAHFLWITVSFLGILITFGASTTALYKVIFQVFKQDEPTHVTKLFFKTFYEEFKASTCVWLLILLCAVPIYFMTMYSINVNNIFLLIASIVCIYNLFIFFSYIFPIIAIFESKSMFETIRNTILLQNRHLVTNIKLVGSFALLFLGFIYLPSVFMLLLVPTYGFLIAYHLKAALNPYIEKLITIINEGDDYELLKF